MHIHTNIATQPAAIHALPCIIISCWWWCWLHLYVFERNVCFPASTHFYTRSALVTHVS